VQGPELKPQYHKKGEGTKAKICPAFLHDILKIKIKGDLSLFFS
jgi:hypothetical protein